MPAMVWSVISKGRIRAQNQMCVCILVSSTTEPHTPPPAQLAVTVKHLVTRLAYLVYF